MEFDPAEHDESVFITPEQARQMMNKKFWTIARIDAWVDSLPQVLYCVETFSSFFVAL
jgi:hypothetical protein